MAGSSDRVWRERLLGYLDDHAGEVVDDLVRLVQVPSISGTDEENERFFAALREVVQQSKVMA